MHVSAGGATDVATFDIDGTTVRFEGAGVAPSGDAALCLTLIPALATGERELVIDAPVSRTLLESAPTLEATFRRWLDLPGPPLRITAGDGSRAEPVPSARGTAVAFTAGVDSFYTALDLGDAVQELVFGLGYDVDREEVRRVVLPGVRAAAEDLGLPLRIVRTDVRRWSDRLCGYVWFHGAALAALGHLLRSSVDTLVLGSSHYTRAAEPWGTHPETDPLWSGDALTVVQHGTFVPRPAKVAAIADHPAVREHLRVCFGNRGDTYNCGRCEKCVRTLLSLEAAGATGQVRTLPSTVSARAVLRLPRLAHLDSAHQNLAALRGANVRPLVRAALAHRIRFRGWRHYPRLAKGRLVSR